MLLQLSGARGEAIELLVVMLTLGVFYVSMWAIDRWIRTDRPGQVARQGGARGGR
ncbi:MAG: hypothetical protein QJR14_10050 [Bacillota bacterium]|nr:hypothetical protein [Bacillota bacterium]